MKVGVVHPIEKEPRKFSYEELKRIFDMSRFGDPSSINNPIVQRLHNEDWVLAAQQLHAFRYLKEGYITLNDIDRDHNTISDEADPYKSRSQYFSLADERDPGKPLIVVRQISFDPEDTFPLTEHLPLYEEAQRSLREVDLERCVEMSGLAKLPGAPFYLTLMLYRSMWHYSLKKGHDRWFIASDTRLTQSIREMFGRSLTTLGNTCFYMGSPTDPLLFDVSGGLGKYLSELKQTEDPLVKAKIIEISRLMVEGLDSSLLTPEQQLLVRKIQDYPAVPL